jgi:DUF917 family protein
MRPLTPQDAEYAVLGGGVFACGGGGWLHHGELMGRLSTSVGTPTLAAVGDLPEDSWVATVTAIGAPAAATWEIQPVDYVHALQRLIEVSDHPITAVMTAQNGYSTTVNGWIQSAVLGVHVLDAAGDVRAHPTGKLGSLGLNTRSGYTAAQVVCGGNRSLHGHFEAVTRGSVVTCDDVLRDISVRTGGFIASARNPVELDWVRQHAAIGSISLALDLGRAMADARAGGAEAVIEAVCATIDATVLVRGSLWHEVPLQTRSGWDHGTFAVADHRVPYLNEYMAVDADGERRATYPDTITVLSLETGLPLAVKDAVEGMEVAVVAARAAALPISSSARDETALRECENLLGIEILRFLAEDPR